MATGIEIIGLFLATVPLAISALEHYKEGINVIRDYSHYRSKLKSLQTRLRLQEELYRCTLRSLLSSELSCEEVQSLFPEPGGPSSYLWGTPKIEEKLQKKLKSKYSLFMDVVKDMNKTMEELLDKLDIDMHGKVCNILWPKFYMLITLLPKWVPLAGSGSSTVTSRNRVKWEWRRIKHSFSKKEREELLSRFEQDNNNLSAYVQTYEIQASRSDDRTQQIVKYFDLVRTHACDLHGILSHSWNCSCNTGHRAYLRLEHSSEALTSPTFYVIFPCRQPSKVGSGCALSEEASIWKQTFVNIEPHESYQKLPDTTPVVATSAWNHDKMIAAPSQTNRVLGKLTSIMNSKEKGARKVQFSETVNDVAVAEATLHSEEIISVRAMAVQDTIHSSIDHHHSSYCTNSVGSLLESQPISLCRILHTDTDVEGSLGRFPDAIKERNAHISAAPPAEKLLKALCLEHLLSKSKSKAKNATTSQALYPGPLFRKQRLEIAVTMASSVLQLYDSPWLGEMWSRTEIHFFSKAPATSFDNRSPITKPYVSKSFPDPPMESSSQVAQLDPIDSFLTKQIVNKTLFALGILLIELCLNKTLAELRHDQGVDQNRESRPTLADDYQTAVDHIDAVFDEGGLTYGQVVQRCLRCEFGIEDRKKRLDFDVFRYLVYEGVVAPLKEVYRPFVVGYGANPQL